MLARQISLFFCVVHPKAFSWLRVVFAKVTPSPFSSVIIGEALSRMVLSAADANLISSFYLATETLPISHLQFVDDTLLFVMWM